VRSVKITCYACHLSHLSPLFQDTIDAMDASSLSTDLLSIEGDFLSSISHGGNSLLIFQAKWSSVWNRIQNSAKSGLLSQETTAKAVYIAAHIESLARSFLKSSMAVDASSNAFLSNVDDILERASMVDERESVTPSSPSPSTPSQILHCPPYIPLAYEWLLKNLHDPYPSNKVRQSICAQTSTSLKQVTSWFLSIRRRIGWTALARKHFANNRSETLDAAYRALVQDDPKRPLDSKIVSEFMELKGVAESLYSDKFRGGKIPNVVTGHMVGENLATRTEEKFCNVLAQSSYLSPDHSIQSSPEPFSSIDESHPRSNNRKRRASPSTSSSDTENDILDTPRDRPSKRLR
jgi:Homeobox KN domain/Mating-type protein beta 1